LSEFITKLQDGQLKLKEAERILEQQLKQDYSRMEAEMRMLEPVIRQRTMQLKQNRELDRCVRGAQAMLKFKKVYELTGEFRPVENIAKVF